jgi:hypothetical protein
VTASPSSSTMVNDSVTFTAQLAGVAFTPVVPSGTVNFTANGSTISGCGAVSVNANGRATCTTSSLAAGSDPITTRATATLPWLPRAQCPRPSPRQLPQPLPSHP